MNSSHTSSVILTDVLQAKPAASKASEMHAEAPIASPFDSVYADETASLGRDHQGNSRNIKALDKRDVGTENHDQETAKEDLEDDLGAIPPKFTSLEEDRPSASSVLSDGTQSDDDSNYSSEELFGISIALPSSLSKDQTGSRLPPRGKELPAQISVQNDPSVTAMPNTLEPTNRIGELIEEPMILRSDIDIAASSIRKSIDEDALDRPLGLKTKNSSTEFTQLDLEKPIETLKTRTTSELLSEHLVSDSLRSAKDSSTSVTASNSGNPGLISAAAIDSPSASQRQFGTLESTEELVSSLNIRNSSSEWSGVIGNKVRWMRNAGVTSAEIQLHPAELGTIEIKIVTEDQQARISFVTSSTAAKDMIEETIPRLKDQLAENGLELDQSDVSGKKDSQESKKDGQQSLIAEQLIQREPDLELTTIGQTTRIGQIDRYI